LTAQFANLEDAAEAEALVAEHLAKAVQAQKAKIDSPSVVPYSDEYLNIADNDGN
jgi:hypothetical protein